MSRFVELNHLVRPGMVTYPGIPGPVLSDYLSRADSRSRYAPGTEFHIGRIDLVANTGTYLDTPEHRFDDGADLADIALDRLADLPGLLVDATDRQRAVDATVLSAALGKRDLRGSAVLVRTGWDRHWGDPAYGEPAPFLTADAVSWLVARAPALVGIDSVNIDDVLDLTRPAHTGLLAAGVLVVEHLTGLDQLPADGFRFFAVPPRVVGLATFTVRAFAVLPAAGCDDGATG
jgi:kynurenine formamidase